MRGALLLSVVYPHSPWIHKQFYRIKVVLCMLIGYSSHVVFTMWIHKQFYRGKEVLCMLIGYSSHVVFTMCFWHVVSLQPWSVIKRSQLCLLVSRRLLFSPNTTRSGFSRDCLRGGRVPKPAGLPTPWVKEIFILFFSKHNLRFFMPDKCFPAKINRHPMRSSGSHGICRIKLWCSILYVVSWST